jgi:8-oxo-dGTP diphosphatase
MSQLYRRQRLTAIPAVLFDAPMEDFQGAKLAIFVGDHIVTILRDDIPTIPWPNYWDLPGGMRDGKESPENCVIRETWEELGLELKEQDLHWRMKCVSKAGHNVWFFASELQKFDAETVRFGDEGQEWKLAPITWYMTSSRVIPEHQDRMKTYLNHRASVL